MQHFLFDLGECHFIHAMRRGCGEKRFDRGQQYILMFRLVHLVALGAGSIRFGNLLLVRIPSFSAYETEMMTLKRYGSHG